MARRGFLLGILALLAGGATLSAWLAQPEAPQPAPDVTLRSIDGTEYRLRQLRGAPVLVTFWATNCPPCVKELPDLVSLYQTYHERGFELLAVAMPYDPPNRVLRMAREQNLPYPVVLDPLGEVSRAFGGVKAIPAAFLIGPDGLIRDHHLGQLNANRARRLIEQLL
jgi:peroxiredoxin